jgi:hypothetical protein
VIELPENYEQFRSALIDWVIETQEYVLQKGAKRPETTPIMEFLEIRHRDRVRFLYEPIPQPDSPLLKDVSSQLAMQTMGGITFGYGIIVQPAAYHDLRTHIHELAHVKQYEDRGIPLFFAEYLPPLFDTKHPTFYERYHNIPLELDAEKAVGRYMAFKSSTVNFV